jgi:phosphoribosylanthranilate isomerase
MARTLRVKICGLTQPDQAQAIVAMGADALGFMCVPASPRYLTPEVIATITAALPAQTLSHQPLAKIGVFANAPLACILETLAVGQLNGVQLHGQESPSFCLQLREQLPGIELIKALRIQTMASIEATAQYADIVDTFLLDAYSPQALGGTGITWDWTLLQSFTPQRPWFLAGGLNPSNISEALHTLQPDGIDLSSGVESAPGQKDLALVHRLFLALERVSA